MIPHKQPSAALPVIPQLQTYIPTLETELLHNKLKLLDGLSASAHPDEIQQGNADTWATEMIAETMYDTDEPAPGECILGCTAAATQM